MPKQVMSPNSHPRENKPEMGKGKSSSARKAKTSRDTRFPFAGLGASAGGLEALCAFFDHTPRDSGMAFVIVQHLDPSHMGMLPELLQRRTGMLVAEAEYRMKVKPDHVYVIPARLHAGRSTDSLAQVAS